jgi:hypothetical protein
MGDGHDPLTGCGVTWWFVEVADVRIHRQTKARPLDRHAEERPHLIPLPSRPFDASEVVYRTVDAEGFVVYRQNFDSVPWRLIGQPVAVGGCGRGSHLPENEALGIGL